MPQLTSLLELTRDELTQLLASWAQPRYRADEVWAWLDTNWLMTRPG